MCRLLAELTTTDPRALSTKIKRLEHYSGMPGVDIRLTAEIHGQIHLKLRALGLDPHDTTHKELYVALENMAAVHDGFLKKRFGVNNQSTASVLVRDAAHIYERLRFNRRSWLIKPSTIRRMLREHPPKVLVRSLGYRSAESLIKREPADTLLFLCLHFESATWQLQLDKQLKKLSIMDFEERLIEVRALDEARYQTVTTELTQKHHTLVFGAPLIGTVFMLPSIASVRPGLLLLTIMMALKESTTLQYLHSYLRHHQMEANFGHRLVLALRSRSHRNITLAGHDFGWNLIHRHFGTGDSAKHPEVFQPHLQSDDLSYRRAEEILYRVEPALHFWHGLEYVGIPAEGHPISFNLLDVLVNLVNGLPLEARHYGHLSQSVWDELLLRYLKQPSLEQAVVHELIAHDWAGVPHNTELISL